MLCATRFVTSKRIFASNSKYIIFTRLKMSTETGKRKAAESVAEDQGHPKKSFSLNPYLFFNGNAREAVNFYRDVFDGKIEMMKTFENGPMDIDEDWKDKIMHASLKIGDYDIMISDGRKRDEITAGNNIHLSISMEDEDKLRVAFDAMAGSGGRVTMPLQKQFWGSLYGMVVDPFGIQWMFSGKYDEDMKKGGKKPKSEEAVDA